MKPFSCSVTKNFMNVTAMNDRMTGPASGMTGTYIPVNEKKAPASTMIPSDDAIPMVTDQTGRIDFVRIVNPKPPARATRSDHNGDSSTMNLRFSIMFTSDACVPMFG